MRFRLSRAPTATALALALAVLASAGPVCAQGDAPVPDFLDDRAGDEHFRSEQPGPGGAMDGGLGPTYRELLAAGYIMGLPAATMSAGVGLFMPVGVHYKHGNPGGGLRAALGIVGGLSLGVLGGYLLDRPEGGFAFTTGMFGGLLGGYFTWGAIDIAFFAEAPPRRGLAVVPAFGPQVW